MSSTSRCVSRTGWCTCLREPFQSCMHKPCGLGRLAGGDRCAVLSQGRERPHQRVQKPANTTRCGTILFRTKFWAVCREDRLALLHTWHVVAQQLSLNRGLHSNTIQLAHIQCENAPGQWHRVFPRLVLYRACASETSRLMTYHGDYSVSSLLAFIKPTLWNHRNHKLHTPLMLAATEVGALDCDGDSDDEDSNENRKTNAEKLVSAALLSVIFAFCSL